MTTYRDYIQSLLEDIWKAYDLAGALRDTADLDEKKAFNSARNSLFSAAHSIASLDNNLPDKRASMVLKEKIEDGEILP
jgi:hypothetical protein